jgi:hypothetical protein
VDEIEDEISLLVVVDNAAFEVEEVVFVVEDIAPDVVVVV